MNKKGILLAGGLGTRLYPLTASISKQLLPVFNKPMFYYPLSNLMMAGIKEIMIISTSDHINLYKNIWGDGSSLGINLDYEVQNYPKGIPEAFLIAENFLNNQGCCLILGDNIFHSSGMGNLFMECASSDGAAIVGSRVKDPERFGVIELDDDEKIVQIIEKPKNPKSNIAVTGIYFYDEKVVDFAKTLKPSERGELEITDLNNLYLNNGLLKYRDLQDGAWFDCGTYQSLLECSNYIEAIENRLNTRIGSLEEIAFNKGWINEEEFKLLTMKYKDKASKTYFKKLFSN